MSGERKNSTVKNITIKAFKGLLAGVLIMVLGTMGIDAVDHRGNLSETIAGRIIFGESKKPCPEGMVFVQANGGDFCVDKYEVSTSKDCLYKNPSSSVQSRDNIDNPNCMAVSVPGAVPWTHVSQNQAARACVKAGKRLPSNKEWSLSVMGTPDPNSGWSEDDCQVNKNWESQPGNTGSGIKCVSYAGAFDMIGNVWEWVDGAVVEGTYEERALPQAGYVYGINETDGFPSDTKNDPPEEYYNDYLWIKDKSTRAISRGGYWGNESEAGQYSHYIVSEPTYTGEGVGFRCVKKAVVN